MSQGDRAKHTGLIPKRRLDDVFVNPIKELRGLDILVQKRLNFMAYQSK